MLHLEHRTPPAWTQAALADVDALLLDHWFCETKVAARALSLARRHQADHPQIGKPLRALAREEEGHADRCRSMLRERGVIPRPIHANPYVRSLRARVCGDGDGTLLDQLLLASMVEARSCERFRLLADALRGESLGRLYEDLFAAEARHHTLFVDLSADLFGSEPAGARLRQVSMIEADIISKLPWGPRIH
jgi:tRNA-(ms[2]io[6]A)-hydroxylase